MWHKFKDDKSTGTLRVKHVQVCWYDMDDDGSCFDESWVTKQDNDTHMLERIGHILPYVETEEDVNKWNRSRVFVHMDNDDVYKLKMQKLSKEQFDQCNKFDGGKHG